MPAIQGNVIDGSNGTWTTEVDHTVQPENIKIKFTPKAAKCADIRLTQHVKAIGLDKDGNRIAKENDELYTDPGDNPFAWEKPDSVLNPGNVPVYIDHTKCEGDPYYNGDDPQDTKSKGDATSHPPKPTEMSDHPDVNFDNKKPDIDTIHKIFETCAICAETGEILGCIWWSSVSSRTNRGQIIVHSGSHDEPASDTMKKALKKFISRHTRKDANGKLHWYCPETNVMRGLVPETYQKKIAQMGLSVRTLTRPAGDSSARAMFKEISLSRGEVGGGWTFSSPVQAIEACADAPERAALKFTWSGDQEKTKLSLVFSASSEISGRDIAPFVLDEPRFANDFDMLRLVSCSVRFMEQFLAALRQHAEELLETTGAITVSIIAGVDGDGRGYTGTFEPYQFARLLAELMPVTADVDAEVREAIRYMVLNFAGANTAL